jgi:glycosyltransferase involved in cell wall biosynthesis
VTAEDGNQEGQGVTSIEVSARGLPIVATWHNGIPEIVLDGVTGFLVKEKDFEPTGGESPSSRGGASCGGTWAPREE